MEQPDGSTQGTTPDVEDEFESLPGASTRVPADLAGVHSQNAVVDVNYSSVAQDVGQEFASLDDLLENGGADMAASQVPVEEPPLLIRRVPNASPPQVFIRAHTPDQERLPSPRPPSPPEQDVLIQARGILSDDSLMATSSGEVSTMGQITSTTFRTNSGTVLTRTVLPGGGEVVQSDVRRLPSLSSYGRSGTDKSNATVNTVTSVLSQEGEETLNDVLRKAYIRSVLYPSGVLDAKMEKVQANIAIGPMQHKRPVIALMRSYPAKFLILVAGLASGVVGIMRLVDPRFASESVSSRRFRISSLELRGGLGSSSASDRRTGSAWDGGSADRGWGMGSKWGWRAWVGRGEGDVKFQPLGHAEFDQGAAADDNGLESWSLDSDAGGAGGRGMGGVGVRGGEGRRQDGDEGVVIPANFEDFGVLIPHEKSSTPRVSGSCPATKGVLSRSPDGAHLYLDFQKNVTSHGWYFTTWHGDVSEDPTRFKVEYMKEDGSWGLFGGTGWRMPNSFDTVLLGKSGVKITTSKPFATSLLRGRTTMVDYSCDLACTVEFIVARFFLFIGFFTTLFFLAMKYELTAEFCFRIALLFTSVTLFAVAALTNTPCSSMAFTNRLCIDIEATVGRNGLTVGLAMEATSYLLLAFGLGTQRMLSIILLCSAISFGSELYRVANPDGGQYSEYSLNPTEAVCMLFAGVVILGARISKYMHVRRLVAGDKEKFDGAWEKVKVENEDVLRELRSLSSKLEQQRRGRRIVARQLVRDKYSTLIGSGDLRDGSKEFFIHRKLSAASVVPGNGSPPMTGNTPRSPLATMSDLGQHGSMMRSPVMSRPLGSRLRIWMKRIRRKIRGVHDELMMVRYNLSRGLSLTNREVQVKSMDQLYAQAGAINIFFVDKVRAWSEALGGKTEKAELKSVSSSIEKLLRSYKSDVSRLLDVSRQRIVFDSVEKIVACLQMIDSDDQMLIVRCKNRLDVKYNSMCTAGYRDVCVNLRFIQGEPVDLGLDCHIVELQLALQPVFELITPESQKRYVKFRSDRSNTVGFFRQNPASFLSMFRLSSFRRNRQWGMPTRVEPMRTSVLATLGAESGASGQFGETPGSRNLVAHGGSYLGDRSQHSNHRTTSALPSVKTDPVYVPGRHADPAYDLIFSGMFESVGSGGLVNLPGLGAGDAAAVRKAASLHYAEDGAIREMRFFRKWFEISTAFPGSFLDTQLKSIASGVGDASGNSALFTSRPVAAALRYARWQFVVVLISAISIMFFFMSLYTGSVLTASLPRLVNGEQAGIYSRFRFKAIDTRSSMPANSSSIDSFEVLQGGCQIPSAPVSMWCYNSTLEIAYDKPLAFDGFSIVTSTKHPADNDPVRFIIEGAVDNVGSDTEAGSEARGVEWEWLWSNSMAWSRSMVMTKEANIVDEMRMIPLDRGVPFSIVLQVPIWCIQAYVITPLLTGIGMLVMCVFSLLNRVVEAAMTMSVTIVMIGAQAMIIPILLYYDKYDNLGTYWMVFSLVATAYGIILAKYERFMVHMVVVTGVILTLLDLIYRLALFPPGEAWHLFVADPPVAGLLMLIGGSLSFLLRWRAVTTAESMITKDFEAYENEWRRIVNREMEEIGRLKGLLTIYKTRVKALARQYNRKKDIPLTADYKKFAPRPDKEVSSESDDETAGAEPTSPKLGPASEAGTEGGFTVNSVVSSSHQVFTRTLAAGRAGRLNFRRVRSFGQATAQARAEMKKDVNIAIDHLLKVQSLDQLYAQAAGLHPILQEKVQQWALESRGYFRSNREADDSRILPTESVREAMFVKWEDAVRDSRLRSTIKWGKIKGIPRSIEKLLRSYGSDPSKLLDVCRQTIVYDSVADLCHGVKAIHDDPEVFVVRCKNRLDPDCNSAYSAGYRDVSFNIRIQNSASACIGVDCHVCEVQLMLKSFAMIKNAEGHARYMSFRNARGE